jgi:hypothetical protein
MSKIVICHGRSQPWTLADPVEQIGAYISPRRLSLRSHRAPAGSSICLRSFGGGIDSAVALVPINSSLATGYSDQGKKSFTINRIPTQPNKFDKSKTA